MNKFASLSLFAFGLALCHASVAAAAGIEVSNAVFRDVEQKVADGRVVRQRLPIQNIAPGERVVYVIAYQNSGNQPAEGVIVTNPVPAGLEFVVASDGGEVSVDGGKSFGTLTTRSVAAPGGTVRPAKPADVTHLRWRLANAMGPGSKGEASFEALVK